MSKGYFIPYNRSKKIYHPVFHLSMKTSLEQDEKETACNQRGSEQVFPVTTPSQSLLSPNQKCTDRANTRSICNNVPPKSCCSVRNTDTGSTARGEEGEGGG